MQDTTTALPAPDAVERTQSWLEFLQAELAPTPGRFNATIRIVVATAIVLVSSITLEVPFVDLSAFIVMFLIMAAPSVTARNSVFIAIAAVMASVVITLSIALTILVFRFTIDYPPLRLGAMALACFLGMYLARILPSRAAGFLLALIIFVSQAYVDVFPGGEEALRAVLWLWVAVLYAAVVTVVVNFVLLPADPGPLLRHELAARLRAVARALVGAPRAGEDLAKFATVGAAPLLKLLALAEARDAALKPLHAERVAKIQLVERLVKSAALLADFAVQPSPAQRTRLARVAAACESFAHAVSSGANALPALPATSGGDDAPSALTPVLAELERIVCELPLAERPQVDQPGHATGPFVADAWTNPRYAQFALKVTLAAMICYIAYTAVDWWGIHTCMITCLIVALTSAGATIQKSTLRLVGCAIGGALALASIVFVVPRMTSIAELVLLVAAIAALGGWIAMGSERTGYVGVQIAFAFYLAVLQGFDPSTDVTAVRDRLIGIVFGVAVMALVFSYVWPERAGTGMMRSLTAALRHMAAAQRAAAWQSIAEAEQLAALFPFEPEGLTHAGAERGYRARRLIDLTRRVLLTQAALSLHREAVGPAQADAAADAGRAALEHAVVGALSGIARQTEVGSPGKPTDLRTPLAAFGAARGASGREAPSWLDGEFALCEALVDRLEALERAAGADDDHGANPTQDARNLNRPLFP